MAALDLYRSSSVFDLPTALQQHRKVKHWKLLSGGKCSSCSMADPTLLSSYLVQILYNIYANTHSLTSNSVRPVGSEPVTDVPFAANSPAWFARKDLIYKNTK